MEDVDEIRNTKLGLGIGLDDFEAKRDQKKSKSKAITCLELSFPLHPKEEGGMCENIGKKSEGSSSKANGSKAKEEEEERQSHYTSNDCIAEDHNSIGVVRKKLRLTTEQSTVLEDSFRQQTTLNTAQKQALAQRLNLKPRQVEVWFQNRRARTKLKQTEVDCEYLRKRCENLNDENRRLKKELQELRLSKMENFAPPPFYVQLQKAATKTISMCPSCENFGRSSAKVNATEVKLESLTTVTAAVSAAAAGDVVHDKPNINSNHKQQSARGFNLNVTEFERER